MIITHVLGFIDSFRFRFRFRLRAISAVRVKSCFYVATHISNRLDTAMAWLCLFVTRGDVLSNRLNAQRLAPSRRWSIVINASVCLSVRSHILKTSCPHVTCTGCLWRRIGPLTAMRYVTYFHFLLNNVMFSHLERIGQNQRRRVCFVEFASGGTGEEVCFLWLHLVLQRITREFGYLKIKALPSGTFVPNSDLCP